MLVIAATNLVALANKFSPTPVTLSHRDHYDSVVSSSARPNGECLNSSGDMGNCDMEKVSPNYPIDKSYQLEYRLQQIDRLFDEPQSAITGQEALGADTTLRQVLLLHRHGDRTPVVFEDKDPLAREPFWTFHGLGQLTNRGKARLYMLGYLMRNRYNKFLHGRVNKNERVSRASGTLRCIESAQCFLSSFLGLNQSSSRDAPQLVWDKRPNTLAHLWQPANVQSVPPKLDAMLAESAECKALTNEFDNVIENSAEAQQMYANFEHERAVLATTIGTKITKFYHWMWAASLLEVERSYFADKIQPELIDIYDRLAQAGDESMGLYGSTVKARRLRSGVLMGDMIKNMIRFRDTGYQADSKVKKFIHYSAHDLTIVSVLHMLSAWNKFPRHPDYGSNLVLELHHDETANEWFIRILYMQRVPSIPVKIHLPICESNHPKSRCTLEKFEKIMQPYSIASWQKWMKECDNDFDSLDPYGPAN